MKQCNVKKKNSWYNQKVRHNITEEEKKNTHTQIKHDRQEIVALSIPLNKAESAVF